MSDVHNIVSANVYKHAWHWNKFGSVTTLLVSVLNFVQTGGYIFNLRNEQKHIEQF